MRAIPWSARYATVVPPRTTRSFALFWLIVMLRPSSARRAFPSLLRRVVLAMVAPFVVVVEPATTMPSLPCSLFVMGEGVCGISRLLRKLLWPPDFPDLAVGSEIHDKLASLRQLQRDLGQPGVTRRQLELPGQPRQIMGPLH